MALNLTTNSFVKLEKVKLIHDEKNKMLGFKIKGIPQIENGSTFEIYIRREVKRSSVQKFPELAEDAKKLGVSKFYLWKLLRNFPGYENSKIREGYLKLLEEKPKSIREYIKSNMVNN